MSRGMLIQAMGGNRYKGYVNRIEAGTKILRDYENVMLFCEGFRKMGVDVEPEWLFYGRSKPPHLNSQYFIRFPDDAGVVREVLVGPTVKDERIERAGAPKKATNMREWLRREIGKRRASA